MENPKSNIKGKIIYNSLISVLMIYFLLRSLITFYGYIFQYKNKLYSTLEMQVQLKEPVTIKQMSQFIKDDLTEIESEPVTNNVMIRRQTAEFQELKQVENKLVETLNKNLPDGSFNIVNSNFIPPPVSNRIFRLELTVYIPAFIIAILWFIYLGRWINELKKEGRKQSAKAVV